MWKILIVLIPMLTACNGSTGIRLARGGKSVYEIRIPANPAVQEERAAWFMQSYVRKMSGAIIPVIKELESLPEHAVVIQESGSISNADGFSITTTGKRLTILGGNHKGCIYGVIELLEKQFGCRMYAPGFEIVPKKATLRLPALNVTDKPVNVYRNVFGWLTDDKNYQDWQRLDVMYDFFAEGYYVHTMNTLLPWQTYFNKHPEYFAEINGKRVIDQPCFSNPEVLKITVAKLKEDMAAQPDKILWSVSQNDITTYCQCKQCKKVIEEEGSAAGPVIRFINQVAAQFPDKIISTLAYEYSRQAPKVTKPADNVQIMLCTIELNRSQPIAEDPRSVSFMKDIVDWGKIAKHIYLWDYTVNFNHFVSPFPNIHVLQPNIQMFVKNNVFEHFQQSNTDVGHEFSEMKSYLISRLLWNPEINADSVITDFIGGYFGPAAPFIRKYLDTLQGEILKTKEWLFIYDPPTTYQNTFLSEANITRYLEYFKQAREAVKDQPEYLLHVKTYELPVQYATMEIAKNQMFTPRGWFELKDSVYELRKPMRDMLEEFNTTCKEAGVRTLSESGLTPENYYSSTLRFIDLKIEGNLAFKKKVKAEPAPSEKYSSGDLSYLTNGVRGTNSVRVHWLGWEATDFTLALDLETVQHPDTIQISSLYNQTAWIFHPASVSCSISADGVKYLPIGKETVEFDQRQEQPIRTYQFYPAKKPVRFVKFDIRGIIHNPAWHTSAGGDAWVFLDEVMVK
ncbi:MAG: DUF4838 domain-containing protein [Bacteroidota bacterium]